MQISEFEKFGLLKLQKCVDAETASHLSERLRDFLADERGIFLDDPNTWPANHRPTGFQKLSRRGTFEGIGSSLLCNAVDQLLGTGTSSTPTNWGIPLLVFPAEAGNAWSIPLGRDTWHIDAPPRGSHCHGIRAFLLIQDVCESQGPTLVVAGSSNLLRHLRTAQLYRSESSKSILRTLRNSDPWFKRLLTNPNQRERAELLCWGNSNSRMPLKVTKLTGDTGDVFLMDISSIHSKSINTYVLPRMMLSQTFWRQ